jgi:hypothetical protein
MLLDGNAIWGMVCRRINLEAFSWRYLPADRGAPAHRWLILLRSGWINHVVGVLALLDPPLQPYNLTPNLPRLIIHMQQSDTTFRLATAISSTPRIKQ